MEFKTYPWYVINRAWESIKADDNGIINTENKEVIEVLNKLFPITEEVVEVKQPKTKKIWK